MTFKDVLEKTLKYEGGYVNDPNDRGQETYRGISRKAWPNFAGWFIVDAHKPLKTNQIIDDKILDKRIEEFYKANFWDKNKLGQIKNIEVAEKIFDLAVNTGNTKFIQKLLNLLKPALALKEDGIIGPKTIEAINNFKPQDALVGGLRYLQALWYNNIVNKNPSQAKFLTSWVRRI